MAKKHGIWLLPGSTFEAHEGKVFNTSTVYNPDGLVVGRYRKMFPFYPYEEGVTPGSDFMLFDVPNVGKFGVSICYDMWFPETTRTMVAQGAEVILHPYIDQFDRPRGGAEHRTRHGSNESVFHFRF